MYSRAVIILLVGAMLSACGKAGAGLEVNSETCRGGVVASIEDRDARDDFKEECKQFITKKRLGAN